MVGYLTSYTGETSELPALLSWDVSHGLGSPCDAFEISFLYDTAMLQTLSGAVRFRGEHEGTTVFSGVVDEFELEAGSGGMTATVRGRGLAALLLDNEAEAAEYYSATLAFILERHVYPWGISEVRTKTLPAIGVFTVESGASQWRVLEDFAWFGGGVRPRFSKEGVLLLNDEEGQNLAIGSSGAVSCQLYRERRYGVISSALVKNSARGISSSVDNAEFIKRGGLCRRVVNVPRNTYYDAMRHTGEYQIERSQEGSLVCELTVDAQFAAFPGDAVSLDGSALGIAGQFKVSESRCWADRKSAGTVLVLAAS